MIYKNYILILILLLNMRLIPAIAQDNSNVINNQQQELEIPNNNDKQEEFQENTTIILGGPASVSSQLEEDEIIRQKTVGIPKIDDALKPWFDLKSYINKKYGLNFGIDYTALYQSSSNDIGKDQAAGGIFSIFGKWTLIGRESKNTGSLIFMIENRHSLGTDIAPQLLGSEAGYLGSTGTLFIDAGWVLPSLYWEQYLNNGNSAFGVGRIDPSDFIDIAGYENARTTFQNSSILGNATIPIPNPGLGIVASTYLNDQFYVLLELFDANGKLNDVNFTTFFEEVEFFEYIELGWSSSQEEGYQRNFHVTLWHADDRDKANVKASWGITGTGIWLFNDQWMPFFRVGWSDGEAPLMNKAVNIGITYFLASRSDQWGIGIAWGDPSDKTLRDQTTSELFYRIQLTQGIAFTPSLQWIIDPALNPDEDDLWIFSLRVRLTL